MEAEKNILTDLGENYEYLRIIAVNKYEIKKLQAAQQVSDTLGKSILFGILFLIGLFVAIILVISAILLLAQLLGSTLYALLVVAGVFLLLAIIVYVFRRVLIFNVIERAFISKILK